MKRKKITVWIMLCLLMLTAFAFTGCGEENNEKNFTEQEKVVADYYRTFASGDVNAYKRCLPIQVIEYYETMEAGYYEEYVSEIKSSMEEKYGKNIDMTFKFKKQEKLDDEKINEIESDILNRFSREADITEGYEIDVKVDIRGSKKEDKEERTFIVCKIGTLWYVVDI